MQELILHVAIEIRGMNLYLARRDWMILQSLTCEH